MVLLVVKQMSALQCDLCGGITVCYIKVLETIWRLFFCDHLDAVWGAIGNCDNSCELGNQLYMIELPYCAQ